MPRGKQQKKGRKTFNGSTLENFSEIDRENRLEDYLTLSENTLLIICCFC